jgi:hypothetical protein
MKAGSHETTSNHSSIRTAQEIGDASKRYLSYQLLVRLNGDSLAVDKINCPDVAFGNPTLNATDEITVGLGKEEEK